MIGTVLRRLGLYQKLQAHFVEALVIPSFTRGQIGVAEARLLGRLVRDLTSAGPIVEIGTLFGRSTRILCENARPGQQVITVDRFSWNPLGLTPEEHHRLTASALAEVTASGALTLLKQDKEAFFAAWDGGPPAMVFTDADHSYEGVKRDIEWARSVGAEVICGDDYSAGCPGTIQAVDEFGGPVELSGRLWRIAAG
ncbi:MAG: class I SAM-dependent methyltransferase [Kiloniellaceae bacterium]